MDKFRSILVPVDLGPSSKRILNIAGSLSESLDATVVVMHVVQPVPSIPMSAGQMAPEVTEGFNVPVYQRTLENRARSAMDEMVSGTIPENRVASLQVRTGGVGASILDECASGDYDLVIVDSGEDQDLVSKLFGSVADKIVKNAPVPVLVLRGGDDTEQE